MKRQLIRVTLAVLALGLLVAPRAQAETGGPSRFAVLRCQNGVGPMDATTQTTGTGPSYSFANSSCQEPWGYLNISSGGTSNGTEGWYTLSDVTPGGYNSG